MRESGKPAPSCRRAYLMCRCSRPTKVVCKSLEVIRKGVGMGEVVAGERAHEQAAVVAQQRVPVVAKIELGARVPRAQLIGIEAISCD